MLSKNSIKYIQSLQHKKVRDAEGVFVAEGPKTVLELLASGTFECNELFATAAWLQNKEKQPVQSLQTNLTTVSDAELIKISNNSSPNQVLGIFRKRPISQSVAADGQISFVLDGIQDPGNLGTIIRTADWFGITQLICSPSTVDQYNPKVVQGTMASLGRVHVHYTPLVPWLAEQKNVPKFAATLQGNSPTCLEGLTQAIIVIGNEGNGITPPVLELVDEKITVPSFGKAESLNAAIAASILMYAVKQKPG